MPYYTFINTEDSDDKIEKYLTFNDYKDVIIIDNKKYIRQLDYPNMINFKGDGWTVKSREFKND